MNEIHVFVFLLAQKWFVMRLLLMAQMNAAVRCGPGRARLAPTKSRCHDARSEAQSQDRLVIVWAVILVPAIDLLY
jgi:hypothetical protein